MEPPRGFLATLWNFICFLPYFIGLLILGILKGIILCPIICLIMTVAYSAIILGLWPVHFVYTSYSIIRAKRLGPVLKLALCICVSALLILWPVFGITGGIVGGAAYGFFAPIFATFGAVEEGKTDQILHCLHDGTWSTVKGSFTIIRDFMDVCFHSYFSLMEDLRNQGPPEKKYYEIRLLYLPGAIIAGVLGFLVDFPMISFIAICKSPYMLFKGWHRLFHDLIGREGPFLETICVPFAGLAILLWPLAVAGAVLGSIISGIFLGAYAGVVAYQESSLWFGLCYIVASLSIYDEYSNDILDMPEGSCFPRPRYRMRSDLSRTTSRASSEARSGSTRGPPSRSLSYRNPILDLKPIELLNGLFKECKRHGDIMVTKGLITLQDLEDSKSSKGCGVVSIGLPAYCFLQTLLLSGKANSPGLLCGGIEITTTNGPKEAFFDWFFHPLLIIKDQIKAEKLSEEEEEYLAMLILFSSDPVRLKNANIGAPPQSERRRAEVSALARRLLGITKSVSRYPTYRRRFDGLVKTLSEDLANKNGGNDSIHGPQTMSRSKSAFARIFSQKSSRGRTSKYGYDGAEIA